jgi:NhaA family Na+:H+ antiporter
MPNTLFSPGSRRESSRMAEWLRRETVGGFLLIGAAIAGLVAANTTDLYAGARDFVIGPSVLRLDLSIGEWAADGLLAIFFFVVGLELKREFVAGDLRDPRRAALPVLAAVGGMVAPALIFLALAPPDARRGWAVPTATDIAFAMAVLSVLGAHLPTALRTFLLTLAIVDDLLAIAIIAVFYAHGLALEWLAASVLAIALFGAMTQRRIRAPWLLWPLAITAWALMHASGIHATIAAVVLAFTVPVLRRDAADEPGYAAHLEHLVRPVSSGFAVPVFAFFAAGVAFGGWTGMQRAMSDHLTLAVIAGLVLGKTIGIFGATWLLATFTHAELDRNLSWWDVVGLSLLAGIGFTVSLLIGELAFGGSAASAHVKVGVLAGSVLAALGAAVILRARNRVYRKIEARE